jgi:hypothetical protein
MRCFLTEEEPMPFIRCLSLARPKRVHGEVGEGANRYDWSSD